ncbi:MAG: aminotransferase class I/II-fold pyridoxal phosphate-dependent enzyme [Bacteroidaceae bacterium]|nr:aminotransferase class I/II-fold pyridoxal phosphate-dependent enzyme [Bacteroidaceae bacterium]
MTNTSLIPPSFESDYNNGAHPEVLRHLVETNEAQSASYGFDVWSKSARKKIREACECPKADIFFLTGGTQANATVIDALLRPYQAVIAVETAHINVHESGAVEASGHKVIALPSHEGRMTADDLYAYLKRFFADPTWEHMAVPGMVYVTMPTEMGTIYNKVELEAIYDVCREYQMPLYIDGARLAYGLMAKGCDFDLTWMAHHCDAFYIGGTKCGALCGEAVVFPNSRCTIDNSQLGAAFNTPKGFFTHVKAHGALLAKSRVAGVQFDALFTDGLYFRIGQYAIDMAMKLRNIFEKHGYEVKPSPTNQQFVVLENSQMQALMKRVLFETWEPLDDNHTLCRFVTSWATKEADLQVLEESLNL